MIDRYILIRFSTVLLALVLVSSCSSFNGTMLEGYLGADENLIKLAYTIAEDLEEQALPPLRPRDRSQPILTTTFVNNNNLDKASTFSRILQEHMTSRFVQMGYVVKEVKFRKKLHIEPLSGEKMLSRDVSTLRGAHEAQAVSVGTYSYTNRTMYISARLIDPINSTIVSSADYKMIMDRNVLAMFGLQLKEKDDMNLIDEPEESFMTWLLY